MIAMYHPRIEILGDPARPRYRFVPGPSDSNGSSFLVTSVAQLGTDFGLAALTVASFEDQVVTDPSELVAPRFSFQGTRQAPFEISSSSDFVVTQTDAVSSAASTIVDSTGFAPGPLADALAVGNTLDVQYFGLSEDRSAKLVSLSVEANGDASLQDIYWDAVFRTWILLERT